MTKIYIAAMIPEVALAKLAEAGIEYEMYDKKGTPTEQELIQGIKGKDALISAVNVSITQQVIESNPALKIIANIGDGFSNIAIEVARKLHIPVTNTPTTDSIRSTSELTFALLLAVSRRIIPGQKMCEKNEFSGWQVMGFSGGHQVSGKTLAIIGLGRIGKMVAKHAKGFDMQIVYVDPIPAEKELEEQLGIRRVSQKEALRVADFITLNCTYCEKNKHLFDKTQFSQMKKTAFLINTARGTIVNEAALIEALNNQEIAGAALDVDEFEPNINPDLAKLSQVVLTPHIGNDTVEARCEMSITAVEETIRAFNNTSLQYQV